MNMTHSSVDDSVLAPEKKHCLGMVPCVRYLFVPKCIGVPVEVALQEIGDTKFCAHKIFHDELETLQRKMVMIGCTTGTGPKRTYVGARSEDTVVAQIYD